MKNYRPTDPNHGRSEDKPRKMLHEHNIHQTTSSRNLHQRLNQYEHLARKAKQQLKDLQARRKNSPEAAKYQVLAEQHPNRRVETQGSSSPKHSIGPRTAAGAASQKYFRRQQVPREATQEQKPHSTHRDTVRSYNKQAGDVGKGAGSPRKKQQVGSGEYKRLHQKLDSIEHKITDMKRNLQRKKEQKQKLLAGNGQGSGNIGGGQKGLKALVTKAPEQGNLHTFHTNPYSPRHSTYYVSELVRAYQDQKSLAREHLNTSLNILRMLEKSKRMTEVDIKKMKLTLPKRKDNQDKRTLVFDLDETLIHCNDTLTAPHDVKLPIKFPTGQQIEAGISIRPYARQILKNMSRYFQIIVFTASHSCYANVVVDWLDPEKQWVSHRLFREHCFLSTEGLYIKDLRVLGRDLSEVVLVDNAAYSYAYQLSNGIPIYPYYQGQVDFELKVLEEYLMKLATSKDMLEINDKTFKLNQYKNYYNQPQKLVEELYINNKQ